MHRRHEVPKSLLAKEPMERCLLLTDNTSRHWSVWVSFPIFAPLNSVLLSQHQTIKEHFMQFGASWCPWWHLEEDAGCLTYAKNKKVVQWYCWWFRNPANRLTNWYGKFSHYLKGFIHPRWLFGISSINSMTTFWCKIPPRKTNIKKSSSITLSSPDQKQWTTETIPNSFRFLKSCIHSTAVCQFHPFCLFNVPFLSCLSWGKISNKKTQSMVSWILKVNHRPNANNPTCTISKKRLRD